MDESTTVVMVPGLRDHVEDHWQTHLARRLDNVLTVPPLETDKLSRDARVAALNEVLTSVCGPVVLVGAAALTARYQRALSLAGVPARLR